jgi:hypothetical protein
MPARTEPRPPKYTFFDSQDHARSFSFVRMATSAAKISIARQVCALAHSVTEAGDDLVERGLESLPVGCGAGGDDRDPTVT